MNVSIRPVKENEIPWVNQKYEEINFLSSDFGDGLIVIASVDGKDVGLGRLLCINDEVGELGGIYVFEAFRGQGIASKIVGFLMEHSTQYQRVYCLPFENLRDFYAQYGFVEVENTDVVPEKILSKWQNCHGKFEKTVLLMGYKR